MYKWEFLFHWTNFIIDPVLKITNNSFVEYKITKNTNNKSRNIHIMGSNIHNYKEEVGKWVCSKAADDLEL